MTECPRCLGKGNVDTEDIKRLKKELFWIPGKCAYCNGIGKVPQGRTEKISADYEYLTTDLSSWERNKVINGDKNALERGTEFKKEIEKLISKIEHLYYIENMESAEIADHLFREPRFSSYSSDQKQEMVDYIEKIIKSKLKN